MYKKKAAAVKNMERTQNFVVRTYHIYLKNQVLKKNFL